MLAQTIRQTDGGWFARTFVFPAQRYTLFAANAKHAATTTEAEKNRLDIQIEALDRQIDETVYELGVYSAICFDSAQHDGGTHHDD